MERQRRKILQRTLRRRDHRSKGHQKQGEGGTDVTEDEEKLQRSCVLWIFQYVLSALPARPSVPRLVPDMVQATVRKPLLGEWTQYAQTLASVPPECFLTCHLLRMAEEQLYFTFKSTEESLVWATLLCCISMTCGCHFPQL